jgi:hypothetical protein
MAEKVVLTSSSVDAHGTIIKKELLLNAVEEINAPLKMRYLANHKREYPLIGFFDNAELIQKDEVDLVVAEPIFYTSRELVDWDANLVIEKPIKPVQFKRRGEDEESFVITLDPNNFPTNDAFLKVTEQLKSESSEILAIKTDTRKGLLPEPRIIITIATYYGIIHPFVKPFLTKMGEKIAEEFAVDVYDVTKKKLLSLINSIHRIVTLTRKNAIPKDKPLMIIFEIPGHPYIELHAKTDNPDNLIKALSSNSLAKMHKRVNELMKNVDIDEAHFDLNEKGGWSFTYLITTDGSQIGRKAVFKKRDKLLKRIELSPTRGHSIGANVTYEYLSKK